MEDVHRYIMYCDYYYVMCIYIYSRERSGFLGIVDLTFYCG